VLGLVRDIVTAMLLGTGLAFDAFVVAWTVPNLFRRLFGEGALSAAFIPVYSDYIDAGNKEDTKRFLNAIFSALLLVLAVIAAAGILIGLMLGFAVPLPEKWAATFKLFVILVPYVVPICLVAFAAGILNTHGHFAVPAFAPALLNVLWIASIALAAVVTGNLSFIVVILSVGILVAGAVQFGIQLPMLRRKGVRLRFKPDFSHRGVRAVRKVMAPVVLGVAILQINTLLDRFIAMAFVKDAGGVGALYYANRMVQLPLALVGIAVATAAFPALSRLVVQGKTAKFALTVKESILGVLYVTVPAAVGLGVLAVPIVRLIFERGEFTASSTARTSFVLICYAATAATASVYHILARAFYSLKDTRTPVKIGAMMVFLNLALNLSLVWPLQEAGLALATSVSSGCNVVVLLVILKKRTPELELGALGRGLVRFCVVSAGMGAAVLGILQILPASQTLVMRFAAVAVPIAAGVLVLFILSGILRFPELSLILNSIRKRRPA
jgi:putative peptidoglycan lipid II flippase